MPVKSEQNASLIIVVGRSTVNCIVVSRIVERMGLKSIVETPEAAHETIRRERPVLAILDGGAGDADCDALLTSLAEVAAEADAMPSIVLLSTQPQKAGSSPHAALISAIVAKPITPDRLQPVIDRLLAPR